MNRRTIIKGASALAIATALAACAGKAPASVSQQVVTDVNLIASSLQAQIPAFAAATGLPTANAAKAIAEATAIVDAAGQLVVGISANTAQPIVQQIASAFAQLQAAVAGFPVPASVTKVLTAAAALLPVVEVAVGLFVSGAAPGAMSPDEARAVLAAAH